MGNCTSSKDGKQPGSNKPGNGTSNKNQAKNNKSPVKSPSKTIKSVKDEELMKHKVEDILQFIKLGRLDMVHGLITYYKLGLQVMSL